MTILDRFVARSLALWTLMALVVLESIRLFGAFVDESGDTGTANFGVLDALHVTLLKAPGFAVEVFPVAALLGGLLALGAMARNAELMAMRAAGVSTWRLLGSVLLAGIGLVLAVVIVSEFVAPVTEQRAEAVKAERLSEPSIVRTRHGYWIRDGSSLVNIRVIASGGKLGDVFLYEMNGDWRLKSMTYAKSGEYRDGRWILNDGFRSEIGHDRVDTGAIDDWQAPLQLKPRFLDLAAVTPTVMSTWDLIAYLRFLAENGQSQPEYEIALWNKLTIPVTTLILLVSAFTFVLGNPRSFDIGKRVLMGAVIGTVFVILNRGASFVAVAYPEVSPALAAWLPGLLFLGVTLFFIRRLA